jgi:prevent-host-death family protein
MMAQRKQTHKPKEQNAQVTADEAKRSFGDLLARTGFGNERIAITRHGKRIAALVSAADLDALDAA